MTPRDYQILCRQRVLATWGEIDLDDEIEQSRTTLVNLCTSAGKTIIAGDIINHVKDRGRCLFIADTDELCDQPVKKFAKMGLYPGVEKAESRVSLASSVVVGSAQTLARENRRTRFPSDHFRYIFVDEAHRGSDRNQKITDYFPAARVCGMTATAFRVKLKDLSKYYETVAFELGLYDMIHEGYISPLTVLTLPVTVDISKVKQRMTTEGKDYDAEELDTTIAPYFEAIVDRIMEHAPRRQILAFLPLIKSSQAFVRVCRERGISAAHVDGKSPDRKRILQAFEQRRFQLLSNSALLSTGWDCPTVDCLLNLSPTKSQGLFRQRVGRIIRTLDGITDGLTTREDRMQAIACSVKPDALILDLLWQTERLGLVGPADLVAANDDEKEAIEEKLKLLRTPVALEEVSKEVQEAKEEALRAEIEEAAKRMRKAAQRRSWFRDTVHTIALLFHDRKLLNYEPVSQWHEQKISKKQMDWLSKNGIDPATAKDRGHASMLMDLISGRRVAGLCSVMAVRMLQARNVPGAISMTDLQAYGILKGDMPMPFGRGQPFRSVPYGYLKKLSQQPWVRSWPSLYRYLQDRKLVASKEEATPMFDEVATMFEVIK